MGLERYEKIALALAVVFGLLGAWVYETAGELFSLLLCAPPPLVYYLYGIWKHAHPPS